MNLQDTVRYLGWRRCGARTVKNRVARHMELVWAIVPRWPKPARQEQATLHVTRDRTSRAQPFFGPQVWREVRSRSCDRFRTRRPRTCYTRRQGHAERGVRAAQSSRPHTTAIGQMPSVRKSSAICSGRLMPPGVKANIWFAAATALGSDRPSSRSRACSTHARARTHTEGSTLLGPCPAARGGGH